ncbi:hypothetical protein GCM10009740_38460 [Terrabacter terrae]|uniref:Uncharacterized protein n=1 Tax=Terrabacter terrae TaxID=318434 RepID=A0ABN1ZQ20_9MICO
MNWWNAVLPVVTLVLGSILAFWAESTRDSRAAKRADAERAAAQRARLLEERRTFELETLQASGDAIARLARASGRAHHFDVMSAKQAGTDRYVNFQLPPDISDELFEANRELARLEARNLEESTRTAISKLRSDVARLGVAADISVTEAERLFRGLGSSADEAQNLVSARLRGIYEGSIVLKVPGDA